MVLISATPALDIHSHEPLCQQGLMKISASCRGKMLSEGLCSVESISFHSKLICIFCFLTARFTRNKEAFFVLVSVECLIYWIMVGACWVIADRQ